MNDMSQTPEQVAPHSVEAEQMLLGAVLVNNEAYHRIGSMVSDKHFYDPVHAAIWKHAAGRIEKDHLASPVTVKADFEGHDGLNELGGAKYLANMAAMSSQADVEAYARMVVELAEKRRVLESIRGVEGDLCRGGDLGEAVASLELLLHERADDYAEPRSMSLLKAQTESLKRMQEVREGKQAGVPTGLASLDEVISFVPSRYSILGGATSMGKTAFVIWLAYAAARAGYGVGYVTLEMPEIDLSNRFNSIGSKVPYKAMDRALSDNVFNEVITAAKEQQALPIEIFSERVRDVPSILSEGKRLNRKMAPNGNFQGFKLLIIDYLQLVRGKGENSFARLSQVANDLKQVAKMLDVHVLALAQVDRNIGSREDTRPRMADLRGSGDLENAPDNVLFIHRPEYYLKRQKPPKKTDDRADWEADCELWKGKAEILIEKARMGEIGSVTVGCDMGINRFWDLDDDNSEVDF